MSNFQAFNDASSLLLNFSEFLQKQNVLGLGIGTLVGASTLEMGKALTDSVIMPLVESLTTGTVPVMEFSDLLRTVMSFLITMFVIYVVIKLSGVRLTLPVTNVRVVNPGDVKEGRLSPIVEAYKMGKSKKYGYGKKY